MPVFQRIWNLHFCKFQQSFQFLNFNVLVEPLYRFYHETTDRVPMSDRTWTDRPECRGFMARAVIGGLYMKLLAKAESSANNHLNKHKKTRVAKFSCPVFFSEYQKEFIIP